MVAHAPLEAEVRDDEIIVTQSGSKFRAIYHSVHHKPGEQPQLIVNAAGQLRTQACQSANNKARELGWIE